MSGNYISFYLQNIHGFINCRLVKNLAVFVAAFNVYNNVKHEILIRTSCLRRYRYVAYRQDAMRCFLLQRRSSMMVLLFTSWFRQCLCYDVTPRDELLPRFPALFQQPSNFRQQIALFLGIQSPSSDGAGVFLERRTVYRYLLVRSNQSGRNFMRLATMSVSNIRKLTNHRCHSLILCIWTWQTVSGMQCNSELRHSYQDDNKVTR